jgi:hypothetical protein
MAEKSGIGRKKGGLERDLGAGNGKPALSTGAQPSRQHVGGAPLPIRPMVLSADPERIAHSLRVLDLLETINSQLSETTKVTATSAATADRGHSEPLAS